MQVLHMSGQNIANVPYCINHYQKKQGIDCRYWTIFNSTYLRYPEDIITPHPADRLCIAKTFKDNKMDEAEYYHIHTPYGANPLIKKYIVNREKPFILHYHGSYLRLRGGSRLLNKHAKWIFVSTPDLLKVMPKEYSHKTFYIPNAVSIDPEACCDHRIIGREREKKNYFTISHSSTVSERKGTFDVIDILKLFKKKYGINYSICVHRNHWESLQNIKICDLYLDQFVRGEYGVGAVEAMMMGKPIIGYIMTKYLPYYPGLPIKSSSIHGLPDAIRTVMYEWDEFEKKKSDIMKWAMTFHNPYAISKYFYEIYQGREPERDVGYYLRWN